MRYAVLDIELRQPLPSLSLAHDQHGLGALVRRDGRPLGFILSPLPPGAQLSPDELAQTIADHLRYELLQAAIAEELGPNPPPPQPLAVTACVVADGKASPAACVERLRHLGVDEVVVLDPARSAAELARGRNRVLEDARCDHVAFLRAATLPDEGWLAGAAQALTRSEGIAAAAGPLVPGELETAAQVAFARHGTAHHGFTAFSWRGDPLAGPPLDPAEPAAAPELDNVLFDRRVLLPLGGLANPADLPRRLLQGGYAIAYEPGMLAFHSPPRTRSALRARHRAWGAGLAAAAQAAFENDPARRLEVASLVVRWAAFQSVEFARLLRAGAGADLVLAELSGAVTGVPHLLAGAARARRTGPRRKPASPFSPADVVHLDLAEAAAREALEESSAFVVAWWRQTPLGHVDLGHRESGRSDRLTERLGPAIAPAVGDRLFERGFEARGPSRVRAAAPSAPPLGALLDLRSPLSQLDEIAEPPSPLAANAASVIVCTRNRADQLERCLRSLSQLAGEPGEIVVIDNDPAEPATASVVERFPGVRHVPESRPGLSIARNTGVRHSDGEVLAFVDDDVTVHPGWLERLLRGFQAPEVMAVTGAILPAELESECQVIFERLMGHAGRGYREIRFGQGFFAPQVSSSPPVWAIGAGANMALRRRAFDLVGPFDERLGAGAAGCSEDSELWYRLLAIGSECRYEPSAVVFHRHRVDAAQLRRQAHDYVRGHVASLFVQYARHRHPGNLQRALLTVPAHLARRAFHELTVSPEARSRTLAAELTGYVAGLGSFRLGLGRPPGARAAAERPRLPARRHRRRGGAQPGPSGVSPAGR